MRIIGPQPISGKVGTSAIADDAVTEAKVANDAISITEMKAGTDGNIISYDASGNPVAIATGNDGQVLTSTGAGSPPAFEDASGGNSALVSTVSVSSDVASIAFTGLGTSVAAYEFDLVLHPAVNSQYLDAVFGTGSTSYVTSGYGWSNLGNRANSSCASGQAGTSASSMHIGEIASTNYLGTAAGEGINARCILIQQTGDASYPRLFWHGSVLGEDATTVIQFTGSGSVLSTTAVTAVKFALTGGGNLAGGYVSLRSYSKS